MRNFNFLGLIHGTQWTTAYTWALMENWLIHGSLWTEKQNSCVVLLSLLSGIYKGHNKSSNSDHSEIGISEDNTATLGWKKYFLGK